MGDISVAEHQVLVGYGEPPHPTEDELSSKPFDIREVFQGETDRLTNHHDLRIDRIRDFARNTLVRELVRRVDDTNWAPSLDEAKTLVCYAAWMRADPYNDNAAIYGDAPFAERTTELDNGEWLPWPEGATQIRRGSIHDNVEEAYSKLGNDLVAISSKLGFIKEYDESDVLPVVLREVIKRMPHHDRESIVQYLKDHETAFAKYPGDLDDYEEVDRMRTLYSIVRLEETSSDTTGRSTLLTREHVDGIPRVINNLRNLMQHGDAEDRAHAEGLVRKLLGFLTPSEEIYSDIRDLYKAIKFENYYLSEAAQDIRIQSLQGLFEKYNVGSNATILDLASGTGWLTAELARAGYGRVFGVDYSERNIQTSREKYGERFRVGDWRNLRIARGALDAVLCLGRSLPHTESARGLEQVFSEMRRVVKDDGVVVFDLPDPNKGSYEEQIEKYRTLLLELGINPEHAKEAWYIVDSPDGKNFYNRFVPPEDIVKHIAARAGLRIVEVIPEDLPDGHGSRNIVYVAKPMTEDEVAKYRDEVYQKDFMRMMGVLNWEGDTTSVDST